MRTTHTHTHTPITRRTEWRKLRKTWRAFRHRLQGQYLREKGEQDRDTEREYGALLLTASAHTRAHTCGRDDPLLDAETFRNSRAII